MTIYCVSYDLIKGKDYPKLFEAIKTLDRHSHALDSTWFIQSKKSASEIRDILGKFTDEDDKIIVIQVTNKWASRNMKSNAEWLNKVF